MRASFVVGGLLGVAVLSLPTTSFAGEQALIPTVNATPNPAEAGQEVTITLTGFDCTGIEVGVTIVAPGGGSTTVQTGALDGSGAALTVTFRAALVGTHAIDAADGECGDSAEGTFEVVEAPPVTDVPATDPPTTTPTTETPPTEAPTSDAPTTQPDPTVIAVASSNAPPSAKPAALPPTGQGAGGNTALGLLILAGGCAIVSLGRRRTA